MKERRPSSLWLSLSSIIAASCASAPTPVVVTPPPAAAPATPKIEYARLGRPVKLGAPVEILGSESVWVEGEPLILTLENTSWDDVAGTHSGRAKIRFMHDGADAALTIAEGQSKSAFGYTVTVETAFEIYNKGRGTTAPHCKLTVTK